MKKQFTFTIDEDLYKEFRIYAKKYSINKSLLVETSIKMWLEIHEKNVFKDDTNENSGN